MRFSSAAATLALCCSLLSSRLTSAAEERLNQVVDRGIAYLLGEIEKSREGKWKSSKPRAVGQVALETYALVVAGASVDHPLIRANFDYLAQEALETDFTYTIACYAFALDAAIAQREADVLLLNLDREGLVRFKDNPKIGREYRPELAGTMARLLRMQRPSGAWRYGSGGGDYDNSCTQFAVLALGVGQKRNVPIDPVVWERIIDHFIKDQEPARGQEVTERLVPMAEEEAVERQLRGRKPKEKVEIEVVPKEGESKAGKGAVEKAPKEGKKDLTGVKTEKKGLTSGGPALPFIGTEDIPVYARGWKYAPGSTANWNMTCAGLSSLLLAREALTGRIPPAQHAALQTAIRDGFGWLLANWSLTSSYYGAYSLEKVADIGEVKKFGAHDWYAEISQHLLGAQNPDGSWGAGEHDSDARVTTAFALLVLNRATALVLMRLVSQNPLARLMVSGRRSNVNEPNDRSWVYVPKLDTTLHYPTLLRTIRLRPHPKLIEFLSNIVDNYPDEWKGELIPELARVRDAVEEKKARAVIDGYLADITGNSYKNWEDYLKWHRRWERVIQIGAEQKADRIPDLIKYYKSTTKSFALKKSVMWAIERCRAKEALPLFLDDLSHPDPRLRLAAYKSFRAFFVDSPPPFEATAAEAARKEQIEIIRAWFQRQQAGG